MWTRKEIKTRAKKFLKPNYIKALIVCIIVGVLSDIINRNNTINNNLATDIVEKVPYFEDGLALNILSNLFFGKIMVIGLSITGLLIYIGLVYFIYNPLKVGKSRFFIKLSREEEAIVGDIFSVFNRKSYNNIVKVQFFKNLYIGLWTILFIIPGIIKSYEYIMVPYILADNPDMEMSDVFARSKELTQGEKLNIFIFELSFLGWYILGSLALIVGIYLVEPYQEASYAELYKKLSQNAGYDLGEDGEESFLI